MFYNKKVKVGAESVERVGSSMERVIFSIRRVLSVLREGAVVQGRRGCEGSRSVR